MSDENNFKPTLEGYKPLRPFNLFMKNNFPFIENTFEALDTYGLLCEIVKYLNVAIENVNTTEENITLLNTAFDQLNDYVSHYFDNLDVQEEINNKLDEMATTGVLQQLINQYFSNVDSAIESMNNKINSITSGAPAGVYATASALSADDPAHDKIYLVTADGNWYYYNTNSSQWTAGGIYQATGIGLGEIDLVNINKSLTNNRYTTFTPLTATKGGIDSDTGEIITNNARAFFIIDMTEIDIIDPYIEILNANNMVVNTLVYYYNDDYLGTSGPNKLTSYSNGYKFKTLWGFNKVLIMLRKNDYSNFTDDEVAALKMYLFDDAIESKLNYVNTKMETTTIGIEQGGYNGTTGKPISSVQYARTKKIKFKGRGKRYLSGTLADGYKILYIVKWYNGNFVSRTYVDRYTENIGSFQHIIINNTTDNFDEVAFIIGYYESGTLQQEIPDTYATDITITKIKEFGELDNKTYQAMGDSITYGFIPRNYTGYPGQLLPYGELACLKLGMNFENAGINNSTIANVADHDPMCLRYDALDDNADIISVMGGANDIRQGVTLGTIESTDDTTFYGALKKLAQGLYDKYYISQGTTIGKTKKIFFMTPLKLLETSSGVEGGTGTNYDLSGYCKAIKDVAEMYSFPVLDLYNMSLLNPALSQTVQGTETGFTGTYNPYMTDGTHPTQEGQELISSIVAGFIKTL